MQSHNLRAIIAFVLLFSFAAYSQSDQSKAGDQEKTVLKTNTRLVVIDVVATDGKGSPVANLKSDDFTLLEDGRPQKISIFNFQRPGAVTVQTTPHLPANAFSNVPVSKPTSLNIVLLDALNGQFSGRAYAREQLI